jgi:hypothetical protein
LNTGASGVGAGVTLNYGCQRGSAAAPETTAEPWTVGYLPSGSDTMNGFDVVTAWH